MVQRSTTAKCEQDDKGKIMLIWDHPFKTSACLRGVGVSPWADGQKVTVYKDQKSPSQAFCWNADGKGVGIKNRENLPMS